MTKKFALHKFFEDVVMTYEGTDCLIWPYGKVGGYAVHRVDGEHYACRAICKRVYGPANENMEAAHSCGNGRKGCVTKSHLSWKTPKENTADQLLHGTIQRGERHARSVLKEQDVIEIMSLRGVVPSKELAKRYGVGQSAISSIYSGQSWNWLTKIKGG